MEKRLAKLEAGLEGREKVLGWIHVNQQQGGFQDVAIRRIETNGAYVQLPDFEDVESRFIYLCWRACNLRVLELQEARLQQGLLALCVGRFLRADRIPPDELFELQAFGQALKVFVLQWMLLDMVIEFPAPLRLFEESTTARCIRTPSEQPNSVAKAALATARCTKPACVTSPFRNRLEM
jgi:hypothetical protein